MYRFPKKLYTDIRIQESVGLELMLQDGELREDSEWNHSRAIVRVFDGDLWYTSAISEPEDIQEEIYRLAETATPNPKIDKHPTVKNYEVNQEKLLRFEGKNDIRNISRDEWLKLLNAYQASCFSDHIPEIHTGYMRFQTSHVKKTFFSSKGASVIQDMQNCWLNLGYGITVDGTTSFGVKLFSAFTMDELRHHEAEIIAERDRYLDFVRRAVDIEPGKYTCVLSPAATGLFVHECFGHKSEADTMLNDTVLRDEWRIGKKVANEKVSICDNGSMRNHGYTPYDDEGTRARESWLIRDGVLTGRLHSAETAASYGEALTGNARAGGASSVPIVRMTNTYMAVGSDDPEEMIRGVQDGLYIDTVNDGIGLSEFTLNPDICYRIRDGRICEPVRVNVLRGNVFETLYEIDAVGSDFKILDTALCGKKDQSLRVSMGGPSIRVKELTAS